MAAENDPASLADHATAETYIFFDHHWPLRKKQQMAMKAASPRPVYVWQNVSANLAEMAQTVPQWLASQETPLVLVFPHSFEDLLPLYVYVKQGEHDEVNFEVRSSSTISPKVVRKTDRVHKNGPFWKRGTPKWEASNYQDKTYSGRGWSVVARGLGTLATEAGLSIDDVLLQEEGQPSSLLHLEVVVVMAAAEGLRDEEVVQDVTDLRHLARLHQYLMLNTDDSRAAGVLSVVNGDAVLEDTDYETSADAINFLKHWSSWSTFFDNAWPVRAGVGTGECAGKRDTLRHASGMAAALLQVLQQPVAEADDGDADADDVLESVAVLTFSSKKDTETGL